MQNYRINPKLLLSFIFIVVATVLTLTPKNARSATASMDIAYQNGPSWVYESAKMTFKKSGQTVQATGHSKSGQALSWGNIIAAHSSKNDQTLKRLGVLPLKIS